MERVLYSVLMMTLASAETTEFIVSQICNNSTTGSELSVHQPVTSTILCGSICARVQGCLSFLYTSENDTCVLTNQVLDDTVQCGTDISYGVKVLKRICTEPVNNMRLCNGTENNDYRDDKGRVEVFYDGHWWGVCDDKWEVYENGEVNANVVCTSLGFTGGVPVSDSTFGHGTASFLLDDVVCNGTETFLTECSHLELYDHNCGETEFVGVMCY